MRPFVVAAVLRGISFDATRYKSFIDLQVPASMGAFRHTHYMTVMSTSAVVAHTEYGTILCVDTCRRSCTRTCADSAAWCLWARTTWRR